jgi:hypothetical protein
MEFCLYGYLVDSVHEIFRFWKKLVFSVEELSVQCNQSLVDEQGYGHSHIQ